MKTYQTPQPQAVERLVEQRKKESSKTKKPQSSSKKEEERELDEKLKETFPASDATAQY